jgi:hypothetical protein
MADESVIAGATAAGLFGIYADLAYNTYSATNSSPQTTELFSGEREDTLWKYVIIGHFQAVAIGLLGSLLARKWWPLVGTVTVGAIMHALYRHALNAGRAQAPPSNAKTPPGKRDRYAFAR